ncbi:16S rRNA (uracil(1498)-N(3))-methyltransferase [Cellulomonas palmilytica]|uniref:16S rRNA (uracil(1498)-N(3))-methyltransferase n=1 Tax=Cellulomonas palmilytica TaxID=2608402 RepID=UPI001F29DD5C|nr:16S rRNA (uracil(1498)-N(3))-methyltransferase [Cellulomonas palmilytica]UJP39408.1 16S rRNA (uracil(1498)-N(3))-methyltransferase [Cellulomonas palmilytica]
MTAPVFVVDPGRLDTLAAGDTFRLDGAEGRHAGVVQRKARGERVDVVDTRGVRVVGVVAQVGHEGVDVEVLELVREATPRVRLVLVQALAKGDRDELAIEAATEVGADAVVPWQADRSIVVWRGERAAKSRARWLGTVRTAAKQSRRAWVPDVDVALDSKALAARAREVVAAGGAVLVLHESATDPLAEAALPDDGDVLVVVGPEGGIGDDELARLVDAGARPVRLGPHVLRTSTAGPVALALLATRLGRWG